MDDEKLAKHLLMGGEVLNVDNLPIGTIIDRQFEPDANRIYTFDELSNQTFEKKEFAKVRITIDFYGDVKTIGHLHALDYVSVVPRSKE